MNIQKYAREHFEGTRYLLLAEGPVRIEDVSISGPFERHDPLYSEQTRQSITSLVESARLRALNNERMFHNSEIFRLGTTIELTASGRRSWKIGVGRTTYFEYAGTRTQPYNGSIEGYANPIGTGVIAITEDGYIPLGRRANHLEVNPGRIFSFGGFFELGVDLTDTGTPCIYSCIRRELEEELGVSVDPADVQLQAIVYDLLHPHPEIVATVRLKGRSRESVRRSPWGAELSSLEFVHLDDLDEFIVGNAADITEGLLGGLCSFTASHTSAELAKPCA